MGGGGGAGMGTPPSVRNAPRWQRWVGGLVAASALGFLLVNAVRHGREVAAHAWRFAPVPLLASLLLHVAVLLIGVALWRELLRLRSLDRDVAYSVLLRAWAWSSAARYVPGAVWQFLAAGLWARPAGLSLPRVAGSLIVHTALSLFGACVVAVLGAPVAWAPWRWAAAAAAGGVAAGALFWARRCWPRMALLLLGHVGSWVLYGLAFALLVQAALGAPTTRWPALAAAHALSFGAGLLAVLVPGGLGVREAALWALLATWWPPGVSAAFALVARLWSLIAELAVLAVAVVVGRMVMRNE